MNGSSSQELGTQLASVAADVASLKAGMARLEAQRVPLTTMLLVACAIASVTVAAMGVLGALYSLPYVWRMARAEKELDENTSIFGRVDDRLDEIERTTVRIDFLEKRQAERDAEISELDKRLRASGH